jgi:hypothetical protein
MIIILELMVAIEIWADSQGKLGLLVWFFINGIERTKAVSMVDVCVSNFDLYHGLSGET